MSRESWPRKCLEAKRGSGRSAQKAARRRWNITKTSFVTAASFIRIVVLPRTYKTTFHPHSQWFTSESLSTLPLRYSEDRTLIGQLGPKGRKLYSFSCAEHGNTALVSGRQEASTSELSHVTYFLFPRVVLCTRAARGYMYTLDSKYLGIYKINLGNDCGIIKIFKNSFIHIRIFTRKEINLRNYLEITKGFKNYDPVWNERKNEWKLKTFNQFWHSYYWVFPSYLFLLQFLIQGFDAFLWISYQMYITFFTRFRLKAEVKEIHRVPLAIVFTNCWIVILYECKIAMAICNTQNVF